MKSLLPSLAGELETHRSATRFVSDSQRTTVIIKAKGLLDVE